MTSYCLRITVESLEISKKMLKSYSEWLVDWIPEWTCANHIKFDNHGISWYARSWIVFDNYNKLTSWFVSFFLNFNCYEINFRIIFAQSYATKLMPVKCFKETRLYVSFQILFSSLLWKIHSSLTKQLGRKL